MTSRVVKTLNLIFLIFGIGLLVVLVVHLDFEQVGARLLDVGFYFPVAFLCYTLSNMSTTAAWREIIDPSSSNARYRDLLAAFWAGHAMNALTPGASLGEVLKGSIIQGKVHGEEIVASLVTLNFLNTLVIQIFTLAGPFVCLLLIDLPVDVMLVLFGVAVLFFVPVAIVYIMLRLGIAQRLVGLLARLPLVRLNDPESLLKRARSVDRRIREFRVTRPRDFARATLWLFLVRLLQVLEVWIILVALLPDHSLTWLLLLSVLTQTATQLLAWAMTFVPGQMGVAEGGAALLFKLLGLNPLTGLSMELVRRIRKILGIAIGLLIGICVQSGSSAISGNEFPNDRPPR